MQHQEAPTIVAESLTKEFGGAPAVNQVNLEVYPGEIFGFLGPNGAGKTTTIRMLTGLLKPTSGKATILGMDILEDPIAVKARIGYVADGAYLYDSLTGWDYLNFLARIYQIPRDEAREVVVKLAQRFDMEAALPNLIAGYSHGMKQKLSLIGGLFHAPEILFLDEPTSGLDPKSAREAKDIFGEFAKQGKTVFLTTHVLEIAERLCDRVAIIQKGKIVAVGTLEELRKKSASKHASLEDVFLALTETQEAV